MVFKGVDQRRSIICSSDMAGVVSIRSLSGADNNNQIGLGFTFKPKFKRGVKRSTSYLAKESTQSGVVSEDQVSGPKMKVSVLKGIKRGGKLKLLNDKLPGLPARKRRRTKKRKDKVTAKKGKRKGKKPKKGKKKRTPKTAGKKKSAKSASIKGGAKKKTDIFS